MSLSISERCVGCWACFPVCPSHAIKPSVLTPGNYRFEVIAARCSECNGDYADPQCASVCPVEGAILNAEGKVIHEPGTLTGITLAMKGRPEHATHLA